ncbi:hypothetical protein HDU76_011637, partial [Blyttiomyces sp. JEL0837]
MHPSTSLILLTSVLLSASTIESRYLGEKKYGNFVPGLNQVSLQVANDCSLTHYVAEGEKCIDIALANNV